MSDSVSPTEVSLLMVFFGLAFLAFIGASLGGWISFMIYHKTIQAWPGWGWDRPDSRIGLIDLALLVCCIFLAQLPIAFAVRPFISKESKPIPKVSVASEESATANASPKKLEVPAWVTPIVALSYLLALGLSVLLLHYRTGSNLRQLGIFGGGWGTDIAVGLAAFLLATPVILILSGIVTSMTDVEYEHPVIESMRQHPWTFPLLFFGAVVGAPLWEEYAFRGLLIRWLDSVRSSRGDLRTVLLGQRAPALASTHVHSPVGLSFSNLAANPYSAPTQVANPEPSESTPSLDTASPHAGVFPPWWPAIVSGVLFGLAHFGYGVSWIPLILFGVISARLFQLRHSILPCIVLHSCFNALSMFGLAARVFAGE